MANFEEAHKKVMQKQGQTVLLDSDNDDKIILCSDCFKDDGLKINSILIGIEDNSVCPNCESTKGHKLTKELVKKLCYIFFVRGTIEKCEYGGFPLIQFNDYHYKRSEIKISRWLKNDIKLIENAAKIGFFYYGPRFWMFGENEPLKALRTRKKRDKTIETILSLYPDRKVSKEQHFYRIRINSKSPYDFSEYDSAPDKFLRKNRFDDINFPVLYASPDFELCLHECRVSVEDNIYIAKLVPTRPLRLLDLSVLIEEGKTEFESFDIAIYFLFLAGKHSYNICRDIAKKAKEKGYDGLIYPSYFSHIRTGTMPFETVYGLSIRIFPPFIDFAQSQIAQNIVLFGRPIKENMVKVDCINKVVINRIGYDVTFGPVYNERFAKDEYVERKEREHIEKLKKMIKKKENSKKV